MKPTEAYKHCLICGNTLVPKEDFLECIQCHYKQHLNPTPSNAAIIENGDGEILLVERGREPQKGYWDLPGGFMAEYESLEESVKREIKEELGVDIEVDDIIGAYPDVYDYQDILVPTICIAVSGKITEGELHPADDVASYKFFSKEEVVQQKLAFKSLDQALIDYLRRK